MTLTIDILRQSPDMWTQNQKFLRIPFGRALAMGPGEYQAPLPGPQIAGG